MTLLRVRLAVVCLLGVGITACSTDLASEQSEALELAGFDDFGRGRKVRVTEVVDVDDSCPRHRRPSGSLVALACPTGTEPVVGTAEAVESACRDGVLDRVDYDEGRVLFRLHASTNRCPVPNDCTVRLGVTCSGEPDTDPREPETVRSVHRREIQDYYCPGESLCRDDVRQNIERDTVVCRPDPAEVEDLAAFLPAFQSEGARHIEGYIRYGGIVLGRYGYRVEFPGGGVVRLISNVYFNNLHRYTEDEVRAVRSRLESAARVWERGRHGFNVDFDFEFNLVDEPDDADVTAELLRGPTRGPYFDRWSFEWTGRAMAHEMGHVLGLTDEYDSACSPDSLMCAWEGELQPHHYYAVARRLFCDR